MTRVRVHRDDAKVILQETAASPTALRCFVQSAGRSVNRETPKPLGSVPSTAAWTMSGATNASDSIMRTDRSLRPSRAAMVSMSATAPDVMSASHFLPFAIAARSLALASKRMGRTGSPRLSADAISSRLRRKVCGDHEIVIAADRADASASCRSRISTDWLLRMTLSTSSSTRLRSRSGS